MGTVNICLIFILICGLLVGLNEARRYGGGSRSRPSGRPSSSRPSSHPSSSSSWSHPSSSSSSSSSWGHPSSSSSSGSSWNHPAPSIGWNIPSSHPSGSSHPASKVDSRPVASAPQPPPINTRPVGWAPSSNTGTNSQYRPSTNQDVWHTPSAPKNDNLHKQTQHPTVQNTPNNRPIGWDTSNKQNQHPTGHNPNTPNSRPIGWDPPKNNPNVHTPNTQNKVKDTWHIPPPPGRPVGPPVSHSNSYNQPHYSQGGSYGGPQKVKIVNKYYNNYPGFYHIPQPSYHYPGYYYTPSYYHYSSHDTGSGALGFFLGYSLAKLTTPTYSHYSFYDGYRPRYDHYTVIHYHHNRDQAPKDPVIQPNSIVGCVGDSGTVCPGNTTSLCTSDGTLMCVVSAAATRPCTDNHQVNCVRTTIPCVNSTADECKNIRGNETVVNIPCVTTAKVFGNITYINNTIIVNMGNNTNLNNTVPGLFEKSNSSTVMATQVAGSNNTLRMMNDGNSTQYSITTTPGSIETTTEVRVKRQVPQSVPENFCVTVVAKPAEKAKAEGDKVFESAKNIVSSFIVNAWGLHP